MSLYYALFRRAGLNGEKRTERRRTCLTRKRRQSRSRQGREAASNLEDGRKCWEAERGEESPGQGTETERVERRSVVGSQVPCPPLRPGSGPTVISSPIRMASSSVHRGSVEDADGERGEHGQGGVTWGTPVTNSQVDIFVLITFFKT